MSEVTTDFLEKLIDLTWRITYTQETVQLMARELLALRTRDVRDDEVDKLFVNAMHAIGVDESVNPEGCKSSQRSLEELHHLAIARGQTRTDAVNKAAEWAKECEQLQNQLCEARAEIERLKNREAAADESLRMERSVTDEWTNTHDKPY